MGTEARLVLAVVLMMGVVVLVNVVFPPAPPPGAEVGIDTAVATQAQGEPTDTVVPDTATPEPRPSAPAPRTRLDLPGLVAADDSLVEDTVWVTGPLYRFGFAQRGARLVTAELLRFESLAPGSRREPLQLVPPGAENFLSHQWVVDDDTLDLRQALFEIHPAAGLDLTEGGSPEVLTLTYSYPGTNFSLELDYTFQPDSYSVQLEGRLVGVPATGWWALGLGPGLVSNEWDPEDDYEHNLAFAAKGPGGQQSQKIVDVEPTERMTLDGPFEWVAVRTKYFVTAVALPLTNGEERRFAGLRITGTPEPYRARGVASFRVGQDGRFAYTVYIGPQDVGRLNAAGHELDEVIPSGYKWLQPVLRPLARGITALLVWCHETLALGYGWILILFGIGIRVLLFPLYQKSMRSQMSTMRVQPILKEIQTKYKGDPQRLQQEMMKVYKEHGVNPLGGCLPMLLPFPILIALFFVFRDTIEFRGVPFLWLPDLSRADPYYIIPVLMGASVFLLQWISQRTMPQNNPQMKIMMWVMPVMLTVLFLNFASGLNLYYATMNLASLPQQLYLAKERKAAAAGQPSPARAKT